MTIIKRYPHRPALRSPLRTSESPPKVVIFQTMDASVINYFAEATFVTPTRTFRRRGGGGGDPRNICLKLAARMAKQSARTELMTIIDHSGCPGAGGHWNFPPKAGGDTTNECIKFKVPRQSGKYSPQFLIVVGRRFLCSSFVNPDKLFAWNHTSERRWKFDSRRALAYLSSSFFVVQGTEVEPGWNDAE